MRTFTSLILIALFGLATTVLIIGCGDDETAEEDSGESSMSLPYKPIAAGDENPAKKGVGDSTVLNAIDQGAGDVVFSHFTHASNTQQGYKIPCKECHHTIADDNAPIKRCSECHEAPEHGSDPAHLGPDDNLLLFGEGGDALPVLFNHFTHASDMGYKLACDKCHHKAQKSGYGACADCHGEVSLVDEEGEVVPKAKRAFHLQCKGCHESIKKNNPDTPAPVACENCHTKKGPARLAGHLTLDRASHLLCIGCHEKLSQGSAPARECADCHQGGVKVSPNASGEKPKEATKAADLGPQKIVIDSGMAFMGATPFPHHFHQERVRPCAKCHHRGDEEPSECSACHKGPAEAKRAFHAACVSCHKETFECADCHPETLPADYAALLKEKDAAAASVVTEKEDDKQYKGRAWMVIDYAKRFREGTLFSHRLHQAMADSCEDCHCKGLDEPSCSACHKEPVEAKRVFHEQCIDCHKQSKASTDCDACHPKEPSKLHKLLAGKKAPTAAQREEEARQMALALEEAKNATDKGPDTIMIDHGKRVKSGVLLDHRAHQNFGEPCAKCHLNGLEDPTCDECRKGPGPAKRIYHETCIPCHQENDAPDGCDDCHKENNPSK